MKTIQDEWHDIDVEFDTFNHIITIMPNNELAKAQVDLIRKSGLFGEAYAYVFSNEDLPTFDEVFTVYKQYICRERDLGNDISQVEKYLHW